MSKVYIGSDFHIGHKNIHKFRSPNNGFPFTFEDEAHHRKWLFDYISTHLTKRDTLIIAGDCCFTEEALEDFHKIPCRKVLVKGNHDAIKSKLYDKVFDQIHGLWRHKGFWLSHAPIHPQELRGKVNIHGHVHNQTVPDNRYMNVCVEHLMDVFGTPIVTWSDLVNLINSKTTSEEDCGGT